MPELPEVESIVRQLSSALTGRHVREVEMARRDIVRGGPHALEDVLPGREVRAVTRQAKRIQIELEGGVLAFHLGMSGRLTLAAAAAPVEKHTHVRIRLDGGDEELRFRDPRRFGGIWFLENATTGQGRFFGKIGPEPLELPLKDFRAILRRSRRQVKAALLDQSIIAGLGNIYADEALFDAGVHPLRRTDTLGDDEARRLLASIKKVLRRAIRCNGSTLSDYRRADGSEGDFQRFHRVYQKTGEPCPNCGAVIARLVAAGRSTHLCPRCQPAPQAVVNLKARARTPRRSAERGRRPLSAPRSPGRQC
ncbi:MAG: formamidopyrimidine-DNA glycosylase [Planctomycetota bacterium]|nr:MAG: formamidopyrimidine-DNA glycosylase [Planctomycetota bacterium]